MVVPANRPKKRTRRPVTWLVALLVLAAALGTLSGLTPEVASAAGAGPDFPRLAVWWSAEPREQNPEIVAAVTSNDSVVLPWQYDRYIPMLRTANPSVLIPNYVNACELFVSEARPTAAQWLVTRVGSNLAADVSATEATFTVATGQSSARFRAGDLAVVGSELVKVVAASADALTVERGIIWSATGHAAGERVAPAAQTWPGTLLYDVSANCPLVDVGHGPERWTDWNARLAIARGRVPGRDALVLDRTDGYEFGRDVLLEGIHNIDPDRSNRIVTDSTDMDTVYAAYSSFDEQWNAGLASWVGAIREGLGPKFPIAANAPPSSLRGLLSGATFEVSKTDGSWGGAKWSDWVVGTTFTTPHTRYSYLSWAQAPSPQLSNIIFYDDPTGTAHSFSTPMNYRRMRFGLTTALLGDGYFCYAVNSGGISGLGMPYFDEYDNAGAGRGYLGKPTGAASRVATDVWRRDFERGVALVNASGAPATVRLGIAFKKIDGKQVPAVNDGTVVSAVTIQPNDGIILLRTPQPPDVRVSLRVSKKSVSRRARVTFRGAVTHPGRIWVRVQRYSRGAWRTLTKFKTRSGKFSGSIALSTRGTHSYRALVVADGSHLAAKSASVRIRVR